MKKITIFNLALLLCLCFTLSSCSGTEAGPSDPPAQGQASPNASEPSHPLTFTDLENNVTVIESEPKRIVSLSPAVTEIIAALAGTDVIVGRTAYCDYPEHIKDIQEIGDMYSPNVELIVSLEPDLIIASAHTNPEFLEAFRRAGLDVVRIYSENKFEGTYNTISQIGLIINKQAEAESYIEGIRKTVKEIEARVKDLPKTRVYYMVSAGEFGDYAATGDTFISEMLEICGGENVAKDAADWMYSLEKLVVDNPDVIITSTLSGYKSQLDSMEGYKDLDAVKNNRVYEIDSNIVDRVGPRQAEGLLELAEILHPAQ